MLFRSMTLLFCLLALAAHPAQAADDIVIGAVYPLTGPNPQVGQNARFALETEAAIINGHENIPMLLGAGGGLPNLGGAHVRILFADSQGSPQVARAAAQRLITQDHVVAIIGSYTSATAVTISQVTERYQIPYIAADNSAPSLSEQGLQWFFRTTATDTMFTATMFDFFKAIGEKTGHKVQRVGLIYEDSVFGENSSDAQKALAQRDGIQVTADIRYRGNSPSLSTEVQTLKGAAPDVVMPSSYTNDAILLMRAMHEVGYTPPAIMTQSAGFAEKDFFDAVGPLAEGILSRSSFALDEAKSRPAIPAANALFKARANRDLDDNTAREMLALQVLADAINRAHSTDPAALQAALRATDIPGDQTLMPWTGVKFDAKGQNTEATPVIQQVQGGAYRTIYPFAMATAQPIWGVH